MTKKKQPRTPTPLKPVSLDERLDHLTGPILDADGNEVAAVVEAEHDAEGASPSASPSEPEERKVQGAVPDDATPENCPLKPARGHLVIVRELPPHERTKLYLPKGEQQAQARQLMAEVRIMAVGEDDIHISGALLKPCCKPGDRCLTRGANPFATHKTKGSETVWELLPFEAVVAVLDKDVEVEPPMMRVVGGGVR